MITVSGTFLLSLRIQPLAASPSTTTMSQVQSTSTSSTSFETIFAAALKEYKKQTKTDIASHPLPALIQSELFSHGARPCDNDACRRADACSHTNKAFDDPAGTFVRIGSTGPEAFARTLHRYYAAVLPHARPTSEAALLTRKWLGHIIQDWGPAGTVLKRMCLHRSSQGQD